MPVWSREGLSLPQRLTFGRHPTHEGVSKRQRRMLQMGFEPAAFQILSIAWILKFTFRIRHSEPIPITSYSFFPPGA